MSGTVISRADIGEPGELIGSGGQAKVYLAPDIRLPDVPGPLVFKKYRPGHSPPHGLHAVVARRHRMDESTRDRLDRLTAWPVRVVEDDGVVSGVLMPLIPDVYFEERVLPSGRPARTLREIQHLFVDPSRATRLGMPAPSIVERIVVCRDFASAIHLLHRHDLVVGDLNAKNAVFQLTARPTVMLVDCDAIRIKGTMAVVRQLNAPDWDPPEDALSQATDLYKFGLFVLRCLGPGAQTSISRDPRRVARTLNVEGRRLLDAALGTAPNARPSAQVWGRYFDGILGIPGRHTPAPADPNQTTGWRRDPATKKWIPVT